MTAKELFEKEGFIYHLLGGVDGRPLPNAFGYHTMKENDPFKAINFYSPEEVIMVNGEALRNEENKEYFNRVIKAIILQCEELNWGEEIRQLAEAWLDEEN